MSMYVPVLIQKLFGSATWKIPCAGPALFLTFDDGPVPEVTPLILDILNGYGAKATFFCIGENVERHPDLTIRMIQEGHAVGNHTYHHLNGWKTKTEQYLQNVVRCDATLNANAQHAISTGNPISSVGFPLLAKTLFRPPYGKLTWSQYRLLRNQYSIVMWDVLSRDYDTSLTGEECFRKVARHAVNGSVIVFHDSMKAKDRVLDALPKVLEYFSRQNFLFRAIGK